MTALTPEQQALAADPKNLAMARGIAARIAKRVPIGRDEIEAAALCGLVLAARQFDPAAGVKFTTFAQERIRGEVYDTVRNMMPLGYRRAGQGLRARGEAVPVVSSLSAETYDHGFRGASGYRVRRLADTIESDEPPPGWAGDSVEFVTSLTATLEPKARHAVRVYFLRAGVSQKQIADELGISESRVSQVITQSLALLREKLEARGIGWPRTADRPADLRKLGHEPTAEYRKRAARAKKAAAVVWGC